jgi:hypothetical protein
LLDADARVRNAQDSVGKLLHMLRTKGGEVAQAEADDQAVARRLDLAEIDTVIKQSFSTHSSRSTGPSGAKTITDRGDVFWD